MVEEMKIAYDPQIFCAQGYGGISRYFCEIASRIAKEPGIQVSIAAPMHINAYLEQMPRGIASGFRAPGIERFQSVHGRNYPHLALRCLGLLMGDAMLRAKRPDIVHETYFFPYRLGPRRAPRVLTIYDMIHEKFASDFPRTDKTAEHKASAAKRADHVICISESTRRDAIEILGLPPEKTSVIYLGFDLMNVDATSVDNEPFPISEPFLLYVGNRGGYKNFLCLLEAYGTSTELRSELRLVCFGGGAFLTDELETMVKLGLDRDQVIQLGGGDELLSRLYKRASAFVYPSLYEGFGIPPLEAMSNDCPVICGKTSSIPEVVGDAGEYFNSSDVDSMRTAIEGIVRSESRSKELIEKGHLRLKSFSWDRCATETLEVYKKLI